MPDLTPIIPATPVVAPSIAPPPREKVMVVSSAAWQRARPPHLSNTPIASGGCYPVAAINFASLLGIPRFDYRDRVETDETVRQLIPVCLLTFDGKVLCYQRKGSEGRLIGKFSVLIGGHVNPEDLHAGPDHSPMAIVRRGLEREMQQELGFDPIGRGDQPSWVIASEDDAVSRCYLAILWVENLTSSPLLGALEGELEGAEWLGANAVAGLTLESWSRLAMRAVFPDAVPVATTD